MAQRVWDGVRNMPIPEHDEDLRPRLRRAHALIEEERAEFRAYQASFEEGN